MCSMALMVFLSPVESWVLTSPMLRASTSSPAVSMKLVSPPDVDEVASRIAEAMPAAFGASASLIGDPELMQTAVEAAREAGHGENFTASQIAIAFNSWKLSKGWVFESKEETAAALRTFAANFNLITTFLEAAGSATLFDTEASLQQQEELPMLADYQLQFDQASAALARAKEQQEQAIAGRAAAEDKLMQATMKASEQESKQLAASEAEYAKAVAEAAEKAAQERARLLRELTQVSVDEQEARLRAHSELLESRKVVEARSLEMMSSAEADRKGSLHKWAQSEKSSAAALKAAQEEMADAMRKTKEAEVAARKLAERKAAMIVEAQSEATALLELLRRSKEEAFTASTRLADEKKEMAEALDLANARVRKAKQAAQAALDEI
mmetsp:Transcript_37654/g.85506  ORF Transcript_37654/g.85506 Transcript_37654/m.85506 type:complete len:384 (-) Transcript_37654:450-1601(-)